MATLVSLEDGLAHLRETNDANAADVSLKLDAAESIILDYIGASVVWRTVAATWTVSNVPRLVHAAILIQLGELYGPQGRGDDEKGPVREKGCDVSPIIEGLLRRYRDPVLA